MSLEELKKSGLLELYVIGTISESEKLIVQNALAKHPSLKKEIVEIEQALEAFARFHAIPPPATTKPMLMARIDYSERIKNGEQVVIAPSLNKNSKITDFTPWVIRPDFQEPEEYGAMHGKIISADEQKTTLIVWLRYGAPDEVHTNELEKFLVLEGSCDITISGQIHSLIPGDYLSIPLHVVHNVKVTSKNPCKVVLERMAV